MSIILSLETSCDESAAAVVRDNVVLSSEVASQVAEHAQFGGVVPEHLIELGTELKKGFSKLTDLFSRIAELLKEAMDREAGGGIASHQGNHRKKNFVCPRACSNQL